jgi:pimeloyl-ACP methyl ester carboxylesterase
MANRIKHATPRTIPCAGHLANLEQPAAFTAALLDFRKSVA